MNFSEITELATKKYLDKEIYTVFVKISYGNIITLFGRKRVDTVRDVRKAVTDKFELTSTDFQRLVFKGKMLFEHETLQEAGVDNEATINLEIRQHIHQR